MSENKNIQYLQPGTILQSKERQYKIIRVLGAGSFGITYLASSKIRVGTTEHTINFAIKEHFMSMSCFRGDDGCTVITNPSVADEVAQSRADFITEANRLKKLCMKSSSIVSVNETFEDNGTAYYVMEYLDGGNPSKMSEEDAVSIVRQLANALRIIHEDKVLHLDVKPDNIVIKRDSDGNSHPVLIDFGISKHFASSGKPTSQLCAKGASDGYAPQEQYGDIDSFSPKYDVYALGAVLLYLITGINPPKAFKISPNQQELKSLIPANVSEQTRDTILGAMTPNAFERIPDMEAFISSLGEDPEPDMTVDNKNKTVEQKPVRNTNQRNRVIALVVIVVAIICAAVALLTNRADDKAGTVEDIRLAAEQGNDQAQLYLGYMYDKGLGVKQDYAEALKWYSLAAEQRNSQAQANIGTMYNNGLGVDTNYEEALKWYQLAAAQGNSNAQFSLGYMYCNGRGVPQDYAEAVKWYKQAADQGNAMAQHNLGYMYQYGYGVPKDIKIAQEWYDKAHSVSDTTH